MIKYMSGDLLDSNCKVICHQVNCQGAFEGELSQRIKCLYPTAYKAFRLRHLNKESKLGAVDITVTHNTKESKDTYIINLYAQKDFLPENIIHTNYRAFRHCLKVVKWNLKGRYHWTIGFPAFIGCNENGGGDWEIVKTIIEEEFFNPKWNVEIWDNT